MERDKKERERKREREEAMKRIKRSKRSEKEGEKAIRRPINANYILCFNRPTVKIFN